MMQTNTIRTTTTMRFSLAVITSCVRLEKQGMPPEIQERLPDYLTAERLPESVAVISSPSVSFYSSS